MTSIKNKKEYGGIQVANVLNQYKFNLDTCFSAGETLKIFSSVVFLHTTAWNEKQQQQNVIAERGYCPVRFHCMRHSANVSIEKADKQQSL